MAAAAANTKNLDKPLHDTSTVSSATIEKVLSYGHTLKQPTLENFIVIWLDTNQSTYKTHINNFQRLVHLIIPCFDFDQCIDFITDTKNEKIFIITNGTLGQIIVPFINDFIQIDSIYIYCHNKSQHEKWANKQKKIRGVFTKIESIYDVLRRDIRQCEDDLLSFNILSSTLDEHPSNQLFIYNQLIKEILFDIKPLPNTKTDFIDICSVLYKTNSYQLKIIKEFRKNYQSTSSIRWFTRECFISSILNKAFRIQDIKLLLNLSFFIQDLHYQIQNLHTKLNKQNPLIVYRGQGITEQYLQNLLDHSNGFLSFNNFLLTTTDKDIALTYARAARDYHELIGILFHIEIDRTKAIYTPLGNVSYYPESEKEILFTIHTIFRIDGIDLMEDGLWQIKLKLTANEEGQLKYIKQLVRKDIEGKDQTERLEVLKKNLQFIYGVDMKVEQVQEQETDKSTTKEDTQSLIVDDLGHENTNQLIITEDMQVPPQEAQSLEQNDKSTNQQLPTQENPESQESDQSLLTNQTQLKSTDV